MQLKLQRFGLGLDTRYHVIPASYTNPNPIIFWIDIITTNKL